MYIPDELLRYYGTCGNFSVLVWQFGPSVAIQMEYTHIRRIIYVHQSLVSVIVPVYNVELYLEECVESIVNQSYSSLEIILIDDGSTDNCGQLCDKYAELDKRVSVIHKTNGGLSSARNCGIEAAKGDYLCFVDSDDWVEQNFVKDFMDKASADSIVCCGFNIRYKNKTIVHSPIQEEKITNLEYLDKLLSSCLQEYLGQGREFIGNHAWNKFYPRSIFQELRYPEGMQYEDVYVCIDVFKRVKFVQILPCANYNYRMRENSIVHLKSKKNLLDSINSRLKQEKDLSGYKDLLSKAKITTLHKILSLAIARASGIVDLDASEEKNLRNTIIERWRILPLKFWKEHIVALLYLYFPRSIKHLLSIYIGCKNKYIIYR